MCLFRHEDVTTEGGADLPIRRRPEPQEVVSRSRVLGRFLRLFKPYRRYVIGAAACMVAGSVGGILYPLILRATLDDALLCGPGCPRVDLLGQLVAAQIAVVVAGVGLLFAQSALSTRMGQAVMRDVRQQLYVGVKRRPLSFFTATPNSQIQSRLLNDVRSVEQLVTNGLQTALGDVVVVVSSLVAMVVMSWSLTALTVTILPVFAWLSHRVSAAGEKKWAEVHEAYFAITHRAHETLSMSGVQLSKLFGNERHDIAEFGRVNERVRVTLTRANLNGQLVGAFLSAVPALVPTAIFVVVAVQLRAGELLSAGTVLAFTTLQVRLFEPVTRLFNQYVETRSAGVVLRRIFEYLDDGTAEEPVHDAGGPARSHARPSPRGPAGRRADATPALTFEGVGFRYPGAERQTLSDVDLTVMPGQVAAVVGPTGAGKTTIAYLVARLYEPDAGVVRLFGRDLRELSREELARQVGMVTQETHLFHNTVRANLQYAKPDADDDEIEEAARAAFIHDRILELPYGYDTIVGEEGSRLSGGERQRLSIARTVLRNPELLLLDEATSALDPVSERLVQEALTRLVAGRTTVVIAHRLSTVRRADVIHVVDRGRVVEHGDHGELLARDGLYTRLHRGMFVEDEPR